MNLTHLVIAAALAATLATASLAAPTSASKALVQKDPSLATLANMIGGVWRAEFDSPDGQMKAEARYDWAFGGSAIRVRTVLRGEKGEPIEMEALFGWDEQRKSAYYFDFHGGTTVYRGTMKGAGKVINVEFEPVVGGSGQWRSEETLVNPNQLDAVMHMKKGEEWVKAHSFTFRRSKS